VLTETSKAQCNDDFPRTQGFADCKKQKGSSVLLSIHPIIRSDVPTLQSMLQVHAAAVRGKVKGLGAEQKEAWIACLSQEGLRESINGLESLVFGAYTKDALLGFVVLKGDMVDMLFASPDAPRWTGRALLIHIEDLARRRGVPVLKVQASINAVGFYERMDFKATDEAGPCSSCNSVPAVWMEKRLEDLDQTEKQALNNLLKDSKGTPKARSTKFYPDAVHKSHIGILSRESTKKAPISCCICCMGLKSSSIQTRGAFTAPALTYVSSGSRLTHLMNSRTKSSTTWMSCLILRYLGRRKTQ
jgi:putative acetyltransferase